MSGPQLPPMHQALVDMAAKQAAERAEPITTAADSDPATVASTAIEPPEQDQDDG